MSDSCDVKPKVESSLQDMGYVGDMDDTYDLGDVGDMDDIHKDVSDALIWSDLRGDHDGGGETCSATQLWLSANNTNHVKRRRVNSEPPLNLASAGLIRPVMFDQLPNLVGVVRDTTWGSDVEGTTPQIRFRGISNCWESEDGSIHVPAPSFESEDVPRMRYNDELLNRIFSKIFEKLDTDNDVLEDLVESKNDQSDFNASIARKIHQLQKQVESLDWEKDNVIQERLSDRILIINVPTKLNPRKLRELMIGVAQTVGVDINMDHIFSAYYLHKRPSRTSPVVVVFMDYALLARSEILSRKHRLQQLPMESIQGFQRYSEHISVDEQLISRRNVLKKAAKVAVREGRLPDSWVWRGNVYVRDCRRNKHLIRSRADLDQILQ